MHPSLPNLEHVHLYNLFILSYSPILQVTPLLRNELHAAVFQNHTDSGMLVIPALEAEDSKPHIQALGTKMQQQILHVYPLSCEIPSMFSMISCTHRRVPITPICCVSSSGSRQLLQSSSRATTVEFVPFQILFAVVAIPFRYGKIPVSSRLPWTRDNNSEAHLPFLVGALASPTQSR